MKIHLVFILMTWLVYAISPLAASDGVNPVPIGQLLANNNTNGTVNENNNGNQQTESEENAVGDVQVPSDNDQNNNAGVSGNKTDEDANAKDDLLGLRNRLYPRLSVSCGREIKTDVEAEECLLEIMQKIEDEKAEDKPEVESASAEDEAGEADEAVVASNENSNEKPKTVKKPKKTLPKKSLDAKANLRNQQLIVTGLKGGGCGTITNASRNGQFGGALFLGLPLVGLLLRRRKRNTLQLMNLTVLFVLLLGVSVMPFTAQAFDFSKSYVNSYGSYGFVESARTLPAGALYFSTQTDYSKDLLFAEIKGKPSVKLIDQHIRTNFTFNAGINKYLQLGLSVPITTYQKSKMLTDKRFSETSGLSDVLLESKIRIVRKKNFSYSLTPEVSYNQPPAFNYFSSNKLGLGLKNSVLIKREAISLLYNLGYRYQSKEYIYGLAFQDYVFSSMGIVYSLQKSHLKTFVGLDMQIQASEFTKKDKTAAIVPMELTSIIDYRIKNVVSLAVGGGLGILQGYTAPAWRIFLGMNYRFKADHKKTSKRKAINRTSQDKHGRLYHMRGRKPSAVPKKVNQVADSEVEPNTYFQKQDYQRKIKKNYESKVDNFDGLD